MSGRDATNHCPRSRTAVLFRCTVSGQESGPPSASKVRRRPSPRSVPLLSPPDVPCRQDCNVLSACIPVQCDDGRLPDGVSRQRRRPDACLLVAGEQEVLRPVAARPSQNPAYRSRIEPPLGEGRVARKDPMVVLPGLMAASCKMPDGAATDPLAQRLFGSVGQIGERLSFSGCSVSATTPAGERLYQRARSNGGKAVLRFGPDTVVDRKIVHPAASLLLTCRADSPTTVPALRCSTTDAAAEPTPTGKLLHGLNRHGTPHSVACSLHEIVGERIRIFGRGSSHSGLLPART